MHNTYLSPEVAGIIFWIRCVSQALFVWLFKLYRVNIYTLTDWSLSLNGASLYFHSSTIQELLVVLTSAVHGTARWFFSTRQPALAPALHFNATVDTGYKELVGSPVSWAAGEVPGLSAYSSASAEYFNQRLSIQYLVQVPYMDQVIKW